MLTERLDALNKDAGRTIIGSELETFAEGSFG
jgi:hypothetical protein